jgi:hypothetical protein
MFIVYRRLKCVKYHYLRLFNEYLSNAKKFEEYYELFIAKPGDKFAAKFKALFKHNSEILRNTTIHLRQESR